MALRFGLVKEVVVMAFDTVRTNKMRSGLTVLGVVIGITSIVGMTALIRGFDESVRDLFRAIGPNTIFVQRFGISSFANGAEIRDLLKRPTLTISDMRAIEEQAQTSQFVDVQLGGGGPGSVQQRVFYGTQKTKPLIVFGTSENFAEGTKIPMLQRPLLQRHRSAVPQERRRARQHRLPAAVCAERHRSDRQDGAHRHRALRDRRRLRQAARRPAASTSARTTSSSSRTPPYQRVFGLNAVRVSKTAVFVPIQIAVVPRDGVHAGGRRWPTSSGSCAAATA